ncbi:glyoxalase/bleomycin resistance/dioxygenase family protein [Mycolicibacterium flavescens]|uniref:Glyoxalase n=1 Tax=Mycolicibacterium flavescens TaxID=1776 RepID=A0A1E3RHG1_MYCFV|nr:glyoxalase/bleomycin resistance/dioxygenase family protein [Mycolicibacterium flavescens]MCV7280216.1 glyoxalase/bleomycin resistance/dioxygenase family protein [Mycolicibacterium flavescens]ODQ89308.1 hypothetical protein BHQ18_15105 [Mycolicibacterium flavescens]
MTTNSGDHDATADVLEGAGAFLTFHVSDLEASIRWYSAVFRCEPRSRGADASLAGQITEFALFRLAGMNVFLSEDSSMQGPRDPHSPTLVFMTRQRLAQLRHELAGRGALFNDGEVVEGFPADADGVRAGRNAEFLWFYDPDGNKMEFCRTLPAAPGGAAGAG